MNILVLAGGSDQLALIVELKKRGHSAILIDYLKNPIAKKYADKHIEISTLDTDAVLEIATQEKANLVTTACTDQALLTAAKVSEEMKLPCYISYQTALNVTNKTYMKNILSENNIPTSKFIIVDKINPENIIGFDFPLIVKPADCNSSKGVKKINTKNEINEFLLSAISMSRTKTAIVEEYREGVEISADFFVQNGKAKLLLITGSYKIPNSNSFTILQSYYPILNKEEEQEIIKIAQKITDAFNLIDTPLLVQLIKNEDKFYVIEFSARIGGGSKYKIIELLSGVNIMEAYVDLILGKTPNVLIEKKVNYALMNYVYCDPGIICKLQNFESLKEKEIISEYFHYKTIGSEITHAETSSDRAAGFLITSNSKKDIISKLHIADKELKIIDKAGNDIMKHGLYVFQG